MQQVAEELGVDSTTFSRQVKSLTEKGLTVRRVSQEDRRVNLLELTDEGVCMLERIDLQMNEKMEQVFSDMTDFERDCVCRSLELISGVMEKTGSVGPQKSRHAIERIPI
jgi:DNA-binding MarR family transcriptional regulator